MSFILLISLCLMSATCNRGAGNDVNPGFYKEGFDLPYALNNPDMIFNMDRDLTEISGLTYSTRLNKLYAINDEKGDIYGIDLDNGKVINEFDFAKSDDYEGIAYHDGVIYVAESNGNIKVVDESELEKKMEYDDKLSRDNDVEGLVYNPINDNILLAAKGDSEEDGNDKDFKSLFSMDMLNGEIDKEPFLKLNLKDGIQNLSKKYITKNLLVSLSVSSRIKGFAPSGVAIHPTTNDVYILSAKGKMMAVCDLGGDLKALIFLDQQLHIQPEGICFDSNGTLFISNEGRGKSGKIYKYLVEEIQE